MNKKSLTMRTEKQQRAWRKAQLTSALAAIRRAEKYAKDPPTAAKFGGAANILLQAITAEYGPKRCPVCKVRIDLLCPTCDNEKCWMTFYNE
jgi:hypothetical protein